MTSFKEDYHTFQALNAEILAISVDSLESHRAFAERLGGIPFPMLSDEDMRVIRMYDVVHDEGIKARRSVFVLNRDGVITYANTHYSVRDLVDYEALMDALQEA